MLEEYLQIIKKQKVLFAVLLGLAVVTGGFFILQERPAAQTDPFQTLMTTSAEQVDKEEMPLSDSSSKEKSSILVDVKGAVQQEGLYELESSARVNDAIEAAGGFADQADKKSVNLAQKLTDEAVVYVAHQGEEISVVGSPAVATTSPVAGAEGAATKINLNSASLAELTTISGIGEKRANDILAYRETSGPFTSIDDLKNVSGIGDKTLENIRPHVTVD